MTLFALSTGMVAAVEQSRYKLLQATLDAKAARNVRAVGASLLASTCDAVVHLNSGYQMAAESPQLKALLLRGTSPSPMVGLNFADLLRDDSDKEKFLEYISRSSQGLSKCPVPLRLRDANGSAVNVHIFHAQGADVDDQVFHLLGIQEEDPANDRLGKATDSFAVDEHRPSFDAWRPSGDVKRSFSSGSSRSGETTSSHAQVVEEDDAVVWFDAFSKHLRISKVSSRFEMLFGSSQTQRRLLPVLQPSDKKALEIFIQESVNFIINMEDPLQQTFQFAVGDANLRMLVYLESDSADPNSLRTVKLHLRELPNANLSL